MRRPGVAGMPAVLLLWLGQFVSLVGTGMTRFAIVIWTWQTTRSATAVAAISIFFFAPSIVLSPIAGALVDRWNRKRVLVATDLAAAATSGGLMLAVLGGGLGVWHLYAAGLLFSVAESLRAPAQLAAVTTMVPREQLVRANGVMSMVQAGSFVLPPVLAGVLVPWIGVQGVLAIDVGTFLVAVALTLLLAIPQPAPGGEAAPGAGTIWREMLASLRYLRQRAGLVKLLCLFAAANGIFAVFLGLVSPLILARTAHDARLLGVVLTVNGVGGALAGLALSLSGGPQRPMLGVLGGIVCMNLLGILVVGLGRSLPVWACGAFVVGACVSVVNGCALAIVQRKVEPALQGRIFGVVRVLVQSSVPIALGVAGPLADYVFGPAMSRGGPLAAALGPLVGTGPGAGMSAMLVLAGALGGLLGLVGSAVREIRDVDLLPEPVTARPAPNG